MNILIRTLILGDIFIFFGMGVISPIFAIFLTDHIHGGTIATAGIASTIYLITKAVVQIPVSKYTDKERGNRAEALTLLIGYGMFIIVPILYLFATNIWHIFGLEVLNGIAAALAFPGWVAIFTKFTDEDKEGYEWSVFSTTTSLSMALAAAIGGVIGEYLGFHVLFISMAVVNLIGFLIDGLYFIKYQRRLFNHR